MQFHLNLLPKLMPYWTVNVELVKTLLTAEITLIHLYKFLTLVQSQTSRNLQ